MRRVRAHVEVGKGGGDRWAANPLAPMSVIVWLLIASLISSPLQLQPGWRLSLSLPLSPSAEDVSAAVFP